MAPKRPLEEVLAEHREEIQAIPGVVKVEADPSDPKGPCIRVTVEYANFEMEERIPPEIDNWRVVIVEVGERPD